MTDDVKRPYNSPLREQRAAVTKTAILDAAHALFLEDGYAATSIRKVAAKAGVSEKTVYNAFGDKPTLLFEVGGRVISTVLGPDADGGGDQLERMAAEPDPRRRARIAAHWSRVTWEQGMLQFESMLLDAAAADPRAAEVAEQAMRMKAEQNAAFFAVVFREFSEKGEDAVEYATDLLFALDSAAFARILIEDRGWSYDTYERRFGDILEALFVDGD